MSAIALILKHMQRLRIINKAAMRFLLAEVRAAPHARHAPLTLT